MQQNPYQEMMNQLEKKEIENIEVTQEEFMLFRESWLVHPKRKQIVGEAGLNGKITYHFEEA